MTRAKKILIKIFALAVGVAAVAFVGCKKTNVNVSEPTQEESSVSEPTQEESSVSEPTQEESSVSEPTQEETHVWSSEYTQDAADHWYVCTHCDEVKDKGAHVGDGDSCIVCGFAYVPTEGIEYFVSEDGTYATVIAYIGTETKVRVASSYNGVPVTEIAEYAFYDCNELTEIIIPKSVQTIGFGAFSSDSALTKMTLPFIGAKKDGTENVHFGYIFGANDYTENRKSVPESLQEVCITDCSYIGDYAFRECENITHIVLPDTLTTIGYGTFHTCSSLQKIVIPLSVTSLGNYALTYCYNAVICCEVDKKPQGWDIRWCYEYGDSVIWGYTGEK